MVCIQVKKLEWNYVHAIADSGSYGEKVCKGKEGKEEHELSSFRPYLNVMSNRIITHFKSPFHVQSCLYREWRHFEWQLHERKCASMEMFIRLEEDQQPRNSSLSFPLYCL